MWRLTFLNVPEDVFFFSHNLCYGLTCYGSMLPCVTDHVVG